MIHVALPPSQDRCSSALSALGLMDVPGAPLIGALTMCEDRFDRLSLMVRPSLCPFEKTSPHTSLALVSLLYRLRRFCTPQNSLQRMGPRPNRVLMGPRVPGSRPSCRRAGPLQSPGSVVMAEHTIRVVARHGPDGAGGQIWRADQCTRAVRHRKRRPDGVLRAVLGHLATTVERSSGEMGRGAAAVGFPAR